MTPDQRDTQSMLAVSETRRSRVSWPWIAAYLVFLAVVIAGLISARQWALEHFASDVEQTHWEDYLTHQRREQSSGRGPVQRRIPTTPTPPTLRLLRDHFAVCMTGGIVLSSAVFVASSFLIRGALQPTPPPRPD